MHDAHRFLETLALVLGTAAVTTVLFQRLRQPVVLGYLLAGVLVGPHVAFPLFADPETIHTLSELGVILLMFALGLEFRLAKLAQLAPTAGVTALIQCSFMLWLGFAIGRAFDWTPLESLFTGALLAISSTTIIAKAFDEQKIGGRLRELVVGILIVEDLIAVLLMAGLIAVSTGSGLSPRDLAWTTGRLAAFLVGITALGLLVVPRAIRAIVRLERAETTLVASVGICFGFAFLAQAAGYSVALGAFLGGSLVAESGAAHAIEKLVEPVKDLFAAIFFVSVGMLIDPVLAWEHAGAIAVLTAAVVVGKIASVSIGAFLTGNGTRVAVQSGMSLAQIGEFSFIIAGLGTALGATRDFLYPVAVAVSAITTLTTPWLIRASGPFASAVDRALPRPLQTFVSLYGAWIERLRTSPRRETLAARARRLALLLLLDAALLMALVVGTAVSLDRVAPVLAARSGLDPQVAEGVLVAAAALLSVPFLAGILGIARRLASQLAQAAFPARTASGPDLAAAPRRALGVAIEIAVLLLAGLPLLALAQPFVGGFSTAVAGAALLALLVAMLWRSASNLEGHVRAGAQVIVEVLGASSRPHAPPDAHALERVDALLPGLGHLVPIELPAASRAVGRTLAEVDLRGQTGATVLAIRRAGAALTVPSAQETLRAGDVLAVTGTDEAVEAAAALLRD
ncbi:MAG TPA: cation:proton antiporter [Myxococcota bacterium]|nr:cation:proton antiporter [Myxococcota bacterium]